jgi:hypothetical protein
MALDLTHYENRYNNRKTFAIKLAEDLINKIIKSGATTGDTIVITNDAVNIPKEALEVLHQIVDAIMYSSGYYCNSTIKKKKYSLIITHRVIIMTAEEKASNHS